MAFYTTTLSSPKDKPSALTRLRGLTGVFQRLMTAQNKSADVQRMQALTDRELAAIGMRRSDIVRYAYRSLSVL